MKKIFAILLTVALLITFCAFAEESVADVPVTEAAESLETEAAELIEDKEIDIADETPEDTPDPKQAEEAGSVTLAFDEGFAIELPAGWQYYTVTEDMAVDGVIYCLSDADGECWLYIQKWETNCTDADALLELVNNTAAPLNSGKYNFNGSDFVVYDLETSDVSCCATLMDGSILNFVFTPQSNADFMVTAAQVIGTYTVL